MEKHLEGNNLNSRFVKIIKFSEMFNNFLKLISMYLSCSLSHAGISMNLWRSLKTNTDKKTKCELCRLLSEQDD